MERNITLDYFKILLCILVISGHIQPLFQENSFLGWLIPNGMARITVPCFFMINGYFLYSKIGNFKAIKKYTIRLLIIYLVWTSLYLSCFVNFSTVLFLNWLFTGYFHLWYVAGLIAGVILLFLLKKIIKNDKAILILVFILYYIGYTIQYYVIDIPAANAIRMSLYRNGLFFALPFLFLGYYIKHYENKLISIPTKYIYPLLTLCAFVMLYEVYVSYVADYIQNVFIISPLICPIILILVLKNSKRAVDDGYVGLLSSGVYYVHVLMISIVKNIFGSNIDNIYYLPLILFFSLIASAGIIEINKRIKIFM